MNKKLIFKWEKTLKRMVEIEDTVDRRKMYTKRGKTSITQHYRNKNEKKF